MRIAPLCAALFLIQIALLAPSVASVASAAPVDQESPTNQACIDAHWKGQSERDGNHLRAARAAFLVCANEACPGIARRDCSDWLRQVEHASPSVVVRAVAPTGDDETRVRVLMDGELIARELDGSAIVVDPGKHVFRYEYAGAPPIERNVVVRVGEKDRMLVVDFREAVVADKVVAPSDPPTSSRSLPASVYLFGGIGGAALAVGGVFTALASSRETDLEKSCAPRCSPDAVAPLDRERAVALVGFGIGVAAVSAAIWLFVSKPSASPVHIQAFRF